MTSGVRNLLVVVAGVMIVSVVVLAAFWHDAQRQMRAEAHAKTFTVSRFRQICRFVDSFSDSGTLQRLATVPDLVEWMQSTGEDNLTYVDYNKKIILDGWNRPAVVLADTGQFEGLGSAGSDGVWQGGAGDDLIVRLSDVRTRD